MNVLHVIATIDPALGGPPEGLRQICNAGRKLGVEFDVLCTDPASAPFISDFPARVHALGPTRNIAYAYTPHTKKWLENNIHHYDAVFVHGLWQHLGQSVRLALKQSATPYFVFPHGMLDPWFRRRYPLKHFKKQLYWSFVERANLRDARAVLFTTQEEERLASQTFSSYDVKPIVVGYGINVSNAQRIAAPDIFLQTFPELKGKRLLLFMGRLHPKKGCELVLEAFARVTSQDANLYLVMAGPSDPAYRQKLLDLAVSLSIHERICWTGMLVGEIKWAAFHAAEAFILASHQENFGVAVVEALAVGLPVLISNQVNIWREIESADAGLIGTDTVAGTLDMLNRWLATPPMVWQRMRTNARACYEEHFRADTLAARLVNLVANGNIM